MTLTEEERRRIEQELEYHYETHEMYSKMRNRCARGSFVWTSYNAEARCHKAAVNAVTHVLDILGYEHTYEEVTELNRYFVHVKEKE